MQLHEKYRPTTWNEFIGNGQAVKRIRAMLARADFGQGGGEAIAIHGATGCGKTTLAKLIALELGADPFFGVEEIDGESCSVDRVRTLADNIGHGTLSAGGSPWRVWIVNEYHCLTPKAVQAWLTLLERLPEHRILIFTSSIPQDTLFGEFGGAFGSRCVQVNLTTQGLAPLFAAAAWRIALAEGLDGTPIATYLQCVQKHHNNFRAVLQEVYSGALAD